MKADIQDLGLLLASRYKLIVVETWDERRVLEVLGSLALQRGRKFVTWSAAKGLESPAHPAPMDAASPESADPLVALREVKADRTPTLYAFCDLHTFLETQPKLVRHVKEVAMEEGDHTPTLVLISHALTLPPELKRYATHFKPGFPEDDELRRMLQDETNRWSDEHHGAMVRADGQALPQILRHLRGLSHREARSLLRRIIWNDGALNAQDVPTLLATKFKLLDLEGALAFEGDIADPGEMGGMANLKQWLAQRKKPFLDAKPDLTPKGLLLTGVQGTGKSLTARIVAGSWGVPLLRFDMGRLYNKYYGESERNLRDALQMAEHMAPCVLWMDELEKGLAVADLDEGVSQRLLGTLLTWMAERSAPVFLLATSNEVLRLPAELLRKGRFDEVFFVDLPGFEARKEIYGIHLSRRGLPPHEFDLELLATLSEGYSGAEIEQVIINALYSSEARQERAEQVHLVQAVHDTVPLSVLMAERVEALRAWARDRAVQADV